MSHPQRRQNRLSEIIIVLVLMLLPLLFWWQLWALDPANRASIPEGDLTEQYYPLQLFAARELEAGRLPAWDPYINAGQPGLADVQTGFFYPLNLLINLVLAVLGLPFTIGTLTAQVLIHFSLASLFTYLFVRYLALRAGARLVAARFAGAVAALTFTYAGYLTSFPVQQLTILETAIWLPLVLLFLDRAIDHPRPASQLILAGLGLGCAILAGHPQTVMYVVYASVAYALFRAWSSRDSYGADRGAYLVRAAICTLGPLVLAVALTAIQLVPTLQFIVHSTRAGLDYDAVSWGFPLAEMTHLLYPGYFGGSPQYVGILSWILAAAALFVKRARREVIFWIVFGAVAFLLAFGGHTFLYNLTYLLVPGFGAVRNQERIIYLFSFAMSILAGYGSLVLVQPLPQDVRKGFQRFVRVLAWVGAFMVALTALFFFGYIQGEQQGVEINLFQGVLRHHVLLLLILGGAVVLFALRRRGRVRRKWLMVLTLGLIWLNLFTVNWRYNQVKPVTDDLFAQTGLTSFLKEQPGTFRISSAGLLPGGASAGIVYELEDTTGNTPLSLAAFRQFEGQMTSWRLWQLLNVRYVLTRQDSDGPGMERVYEEGEVKVYRMGDPLPRAWVVHDTLVSDDEQVFDHLNADDFDPKTTAVLPEEHAEFALSGGGQSDSSTRVVEARPGRLVVDVSSGSDGLLVVSQPFYPGWQAQVDGAQVPVARVDYLLQGVPVRAGDQRVALDYRPLPLPAIVSLVALLGCLAVLFAGLRADSKRERRKT